MLVTIRRALIMVTAITVTAAVPADAATLRPPAVTKLSVASGPTSGGTSVSVRGSGFTHVTKVTFGRAAGAHLHVVSSTLLTVVAPKSRAGTVDVRVVRSYKGVTKQSATSVADHFTFYAPPSITKVTPVSGPTTGGSVVEIAGTNLRAIKKIRFGTASGSHIHVASTTRLTVTAPAHKTGSVTITISGAYGSGTSAKALPAGWSYVVPPVDPVRNVTSTSTSTSVTLHWQSPTTDISGVLIRRLAGPSAPSSPSDGQLVSDVVGDESFTDSGLTPGTQYSYALFAHDSQQRFATAANLTTLTFAAGTDITSWSGPAAPFGPLHGSPGAVSCVSPTFCQSIDGYGGVFTFDGTSWTRTGNLGYGGGGFFTQVQCLSPTWCIASNYSSDVFHFDGTSWTAMVNVDGGPVAGDDEVTALSCVSTTFCVAATEQGNAAVYRGSAWSRVATADPVLNNTYSRIESLSCASTTFCSAADTFGRIVTWDGSAWSTPKAVGDNGNHASMSCATPSYCLAVFPVDSTNLVSQFDGTTWRTAPAAPAGFSPRTAICHSVSFCLVLDDYGSSVFDGTTWSRAENIDSDSSLPASGSCASETFCVALTYDGAAVRNASGWSAVKVFDPTGGGVMAVSCAAGPYCLAADIGGNAKAYHDGAWSDVAAYGAVANQISCVSSAFCAAIGDDSIRTFDGSSWSNTYYAASYNLQDISCSSSTYCVAIDSNGATYTFDGTQWTAISAPPLSGRVLTSVACSTNGHCVALAAGDDEKVVSFSLNGSTWGPAKPVGGVSTGPISCASDTLCFAADGDQLFRFDGSSWNAVRAIGMGVNGVSCGSPTFCVAIGYSTVSTFDGSMWSTPVAVDAAATALRDVECTIDHHCLVLDDIVGVYFSG